MAIITSRDFQALTQVDSYAVICELLYAIKDDPNYSIISELVYLLDKDSFINLIKYFGGTEIKIPSVEEFKETIQIILLYKYFKLDNLSWVDALKKADIENKHNKKFQKKLLAFEEVIKTQKIRKQQGGKL